MSNSSYEVDEKFRNFLLSQQEKQAEASKPAEEFRRSRIEEEQQIKDALNRQERKDDIVSQTDFEDLSTRRRNERIEAQTRSVLSRLIDDMNDGKDMEARVSIEQLKEIMLKNDISNETAKQVNEALINLIDRVDSSFTEASVQRKVLKALNSAETISRIKEEKPEDFQRRLRLLKMSDVDTLDDEDARKLAIFLGVDPDGKSERALKDEIKNSIVKDVTNGAIANAKKYEDRIDDLARDLRTRLDAHMTATNRAKFLKPFKNEGDTNIDAYKDIVKQRLDRAALITQMPTPEMAHDDMIIQVRTKVLSDPLIPEYMRLELADNVFDFSSDNAAEKQQLIKMWKYYHVPDLDRIDKMGKFADDSFVRGRLANEDELAESRQQNFTIIRNLLMDLPTAEARRNVVSDALDVSLEDASKILSRITNPRILVGSLSDDEIQDIYNVGDYIMEAQRTAAARAALTAPSSVSAAERAAFVSIPADDSDGEEDEPEDDDFIPRPGAAAAAASASAAAPALAPAPAPAPEATRRGPPATPARPKSKAKSAAAGDDEEEEGSGFSMISQLKDHVNMLHNTKKITKVKLSNAIKLIDTAAKMGKMSELANALKKIGL